MGVTDHVAVQALNALDIDAQDHKYLSDILDPDKSGSITVLEFVRGLKRLRGEPRRSDIVTVDLMMRSLHEKIDVVVERMKKENFKRQMPKQLRDPEGADEGTAIAGDCVEASASTKSVASSS